MTIDSRIEKWAIDSRIEAWAIERGLDKIEYNHWFAKASQAEEVSEEYRGRGNDDKHEVIDAICDQYVYATVDLLKENSNKEYLNDVKNSCKQICIDEFNTDIDLFLNETLKEIESRDGAWSDEHGKWKKYTDPASKLKWYKADYGNINKENIDLDYIVKTIGDHVLFENKYTGEVLSLTDLHDVLSPGDINSSKIVSDSVETILVTDDAKYTILDTIRVKL